MLEILAGTVMVVTISMAAISAIMYQQRDYGRLRHSQRMTEPAMPTIPEESSRSSSSMLTHTHIARNFMRAGATL